MAKGAPYPNEFKQEAIRLTVDSGRSVAQVAKDPGISVNTLHDWRRLERELAVVTEERDIIKRAIAYFAKPPKK